MAGVSGIGRPGVVESDDGPNRNLHRADRHRTRLAKLPLLMAHVRSHRWRGSVGVVSRGDGGRGKEQQNGFLVAEKADAAALLSQRPYRHIESYGKKCQKNRRSSVPAMPLIIHRSTTAPNVVPCKARLPEQMLPGACDWGRRQAAFPRSTVVLGTWSPPA